jgi:hypothetical protein
VAGRGRKRRETYGVEHAEHHGPLSLAAGVVGNPGHDPAREKGKKEDRGQLDARRLEQEELQQTKECWHSQHWRGSSKRSSEREAHPQRRRQGQRREESTCKRRNESVSRSRRAKGEANVPPDDTDAEDDHDGDTAGLKAIRDGRHEKHHPESDGVRRDGIDLGVRSGVAETLYDVEGVRSDF